MSEASTITPRREKTRQRLMAAAESVIAEKGVLAASVEEICERAGFTRGAFYSNFESKEDLALDIMRVRCEQHLVAADAALTQAVAHSRPGETVRELIMRATQVFQASQPSGRDAVLLQAELRLHAVRNREFGRAYAAFDQEVTTLFTRVINSALSSRGLTLAIPARQAIDMLHDIHAAASMDALMDERRDHDLADNLATLVLALVREG